MRLLALLVLSICLPLSAHAQAVMLKQLRVLPSEKQTRLLFVLDQKTLGKIKYLPNPDRVQIEFKKTKIKFDLNQALFANSNVISINAKRDFIGTLRFTLLLKNKVSWKIQFLPPENNNTVLEITLNSQALPALKNKFAADIKNNAAAMPAEIELKKISLDMPPPTPKSEPTPIAATPSIPASATLTPFTVVIDAGHGGKDPGTIAKIGIQEKDVVLSIAKKLAELINQTPFMRAKLTRDDDYFVPLRGRLKLARKGDADLFIAIHADSYFDNNKRGVSVFALSEHGATSEAARWVAKRDNYAELDDVELNALKDHSTMLRSVLIDLAQTATIEDSVKLGTFVLNALDDVSTLHYKQVEQAPFMVLKSPDIPSILVETGYLSNPFEAARLATSYYQGRVAHAIWQGVVQYREQRK